MFKERGDSCRTWSREGRKCASGSNEIASNVESLRACSFPLSDTFQGAGPHGSAAQIVAKMAASSCAASLNLGQHSFACLRSCGSVRVLLWHHKHLSIVYPAAFPTESPLL